MSSSLHSGALLASDSSPLRLVRVRGRVRVRGIVRVRGRVRADRRAWLGAGAGLG